MFEELRENFKEVLRLAELHHKSYKTSHVRLASDTITQSKEYEESEE